MKLSLDGMAFVLRIVLHCSFFIISCIHTKSPIPHPEKQPQIITDPLLCFTDGTTQVSNIFSLVRFQTKIHLFIPNILNVDLSSKEHFKNLFLSDLNMQGPTGFISSRSEVLIVIFNGNTAKQISISQSSFYSNEHYRF